MISLTPIVSRLKTKWNKLQTNKKLALNSQLQTYKILKNDDRMLILCLSYFITTVFKNRITSKPILLSKSSTVFGGPSWLFCILCEVTDFCLCSDDLKTCRSGSSSTFMNLKWPIRPWHRPRHSPLGFMAMISIVSPLWKKYIR